MSPENNQSKGEIFLRAVIKASRAIGVVGCASSLYVAKRCLEAKNYTACGVMLGLAVTHACLASSIFEGSLRKNNNLGA